MTHPSAGVPAAERVRALELCGGDERITAGRLPEMLSLAAAEIAEKATLVTRDLDFAEIFSGSGAASAAVRKAGGS